MGCFISKYFHSALHGSVPLCPCQNAHWQQRIMEDAIGRNARGCPCILLCRDSSKTFSGPCLCRAWGFPRLQPAAGGGTPGVHTNTSTPYSLHLHLLLQGHPLFSIREPVMPRTHPRRNLCNRRLTPVNKWLCIPICISSVGQRMHGKKQPGWLEPHQVASPTSSSPF